MPIILVGPPYPRADLIIVPKRDYGVDGQEVSMFAKAWVMVSEPEAQLVISFQNEPVPTALGMESDPSKRKVPALSTAAPTTLSTGSPYQLTSASFCGAIAPPCSIHVLRCMPIV